MTSSRTSTNNSSRTSTAPRHHRIDDASCRQATTALEFVGRRWTGAILLALGRGATRFSEVQDAVEGLSARLLTARLQELGEHGLVEREVTPTMPVSVRYHLTPQGRELLAALQPLQVYQARWGRG